MNQPSRWRVLRTIFAISWRASLRERVFSVVGVLAVLLLGASLFFQTLEFGADSLGFLADFGFGLVLVFGSILAVVLPSHRWFAEMNEKRCLPVLSRSVGRGTYFLGHWLGLAGVLSVFVFGTMGVLGLLLIWQSGGSVASGDFFTALVASSALQAARLWVIAAFVFLLGSFARGGLLVLSLAFVFVLSGQLMPAALASQTASPGVLGAVWQGVLLLVPNLGAFALDAGVLLGGARRMELGPLMLYSALYSAVYVALGAWAFSKRELT